MDGRARQGKRARGADRHLRGAPGLLAPEEREGLSLLPRARPRARRLRGRAGLHPRRAPARDGASLLRVLGLPDDRLLRSDRPVRHAAGPDVPRRSPPSARHRRDLRLGAVALPVGRARPRLFRRDASLRARGSAAGLPPGLEDVHLQLRTQRGAQLPAVVRAVLARALSRRRPARGRGRLDAAPRLFAQSRRVDSEPLRRPGEPRGAPLPAAAERGGLRPLPGRPDDGGGVHDVADGLAPDVRRRARLRDEVGPRLDARHARLSWPGPDPPEVPPQPADVPHDLRGKRELSPSAVARRGRPREVLARRQDAGRRVAEDGEPAAAARRPLHTARQEAPLHGRRIRTVARVVARPGARLGSAESSPPSRRAASRRGAQSHLPRGARSPRARRGRAGRLRVGGLPRRRGEHALIPAERENDARSDPRRLQLHAGAAPGVPRRSAARGNLEAPRQYGRPDLRRQRLLFQRRRPGGRGAAPRPAVLADARPPAARGAFVQAGSASPGRKPTKARRLRRSPSRSTSNPSSRRNSPSRTRSWRDAIRLRPRPFLPAAAREPVARGDRGPGLGVPVPRLERAHHRRVLRRQRGVPDPGLGGPDRRDRQQLRAHQFRFRADAALLARAPRARRVRGGPRRRPGEPRAIRRARLGPRAGIQPRHPAARRRARPPHAGALGDRGLPAPVRAGPERDVAARDGGGRPEPRGDRGGGHPIHDPRAASGARAPPDRDGGVERGRARRHRFDARLPRSAAFGALDRRLLLRRRDRARRRFRRSPPQRPAARRATRGRVPGDGRSAAPRERRHGR